MAPPKGHIRERGLPKTNPGSNTRESTPRGSQKYYKLIQNAGVRLQNTPRLRRRKKKNHRSTASESPRRGQEGKSQHGDKGSTKRQYGKLIRMDHNKFLNPTFERTGRKLGPKEVIRTRLGTTGIKTHWSPPLPQHTTIRL